MALNGILAGLVGITAGADQMSGWESIVIGAIAGVLVYVAVLFVDIVGYTRLMGADQPWRGLEAYVPRSESGRLAQAMYIAQNPRPVPVMTIVSP